MNYRALIENVKARSNPENLLLEKAFQSELQDISYGDVEKYIKLAMRGVEPEYTKRSKEAGKRVQNHLRVSLKLEGFKKAIVLFSYETIYSTYLFSNNRTQS